jgi:hypothetical protein
MVDKSNVQEVAGDPIGTAPHPMRNLLIGAAILAIAGLIGLFYWRGGKSDDAALVELQQFRQAMATQCKQEQFAKPIPKGLSSLYADSSRMQAVVHEQAGNLQRGQANCEQIVKSLKSVDFPVE